MGNWDGGSVQCVASIPCADRSAGGEDGGEDWTRVWRVTGLCWGIEREETGLRRIHQETYYWDEGGRARRYHGGCCGLKASFELLRYFYVSTSPLQLNYPRAPKKQPLAPTLAQLGIDLQSPKPLPSEGEASSTPEGAEGHFPLSTHDICLHLPDYHILVLKSLCEGAILRLADHEIAVPSTARWCRTKPPCRASPARLDRSLDLVDQDQAPTHRPA